MGLMMTIAEERLEDYLLTKNIKIMVTREFLLRNGFIRDFSSPECVEDYYLKELKGSYLSVRFKPNIEEAIGLYAYSENEHQNIRKVVLSDTRVSVRDYEIAKEICNM